MGTIASVIPSKKNSTWNQPRVQAGRCALRNECIWRIARGIRSLGSFHGNMLTSALGASIAASIATAYGCAGISSGRIRTGVWQWRTKSRVTVRTKSVFVRYILVRYAPSTAHLYVAWSNGGASYNGSGVAPAGDKHGVTAFRINRQSGALQIHGAPAALRWRPIYITGDIPGRHLLVAYNDTSGVSVHTIESDG